MTAGEGKAFTTSFDLGAHSDAPDVLSSALTYHLLTEDWKCWGDAKK